VLRVKAPAIMTGRTIISEVSLLSIYDRVPEGSNRAIEGSRVLDCHAHSIIDGNHVAHPCLFGFEHSADAVIPTLVAIEMTAGVTCRMITNRRIREDMRT
jgi:hypothetical protein